MRLPTLLRRWRRGQILALSLRAVGLALGTGALLWAALPEGAARWLVVTLVALATAGLSVRLPRPPMADARLLARHLDRHVDDLEDSAGLLLRPSNDLSGLERLQASRMRQVLAELSADGFWPRSQVLRSLRALVGGVVVALLVTWSQLRADLPAAPAQDDDSLAATSSTARDDPWSLVRVEVEPPGYSALPSTEQSDLDVETLEGAVIRWWLPVEATPARLEFATGETLELQPGEAGAVAELTARDSDVYRLVVERQGRQQRSAYARLVVLPDRPPEVRIVEPEERVTRLAGSPAPLTLGLVVADDFGIEQVELVSTLALGAGELVEFRQHRQRLVTAPPDRRIDLRRRVDLPAVGLQPGSELYLFVEATDNRRPRSQIGRSVTYIVRLPGERLASADLGEGIPIVLPPEYFRSQRQIILDTERLLAEEADLPVAEFRRRSADLGFDQRALRMRYGTLLGEEFESGQPVEAGEEEHAGGEDHDHASEPAPMEAADGDSTDDVLSQFGHSHDSAEIATYFTSETRAQLKRVLAAMWDAEGRLRGHRPQEALPHEYRALELLKELQQRSRLYVQKVGFETPPLEPQELRLTGELDDILSRSRVVEPPPDDPLVAAVRQVLALVESDRATDELSPAVLAQVRSALAQRAVAEPAVLDALDALAVLESGGSLDAARRNSVTEALSRLLPVPARPAGRRAAPLDPLTVIYRSAMAAGEGT